MCSDVVMEIPKKTFEVIIDEVKEAKGGVNDIDLGVEDMKLLVKRFKEYYKEQKGTDFPSDPKAVSYTHLDVYKRQRLFSIAYPG